MECVRLTDTAIKKEFKKKTNTKTMDQPSEKLAVAHCVRDFSQCYGTQAVITITWNVLRLRSQQMVFR